MRRTDDQWTAFLSSRIPSILSSSRQQAAAPIPSCPASTIDHTLLAPTATRADIDALCDEAIYYKFRSVCVNSIFAQHVSLRLRDTGVKTCVVVGFPLGASDLNSTISECKNAILLGASEVDVPMPQAYIQSKPPQYDDLHQHLFQLVEAVSPHPLKVILETVFLSPEQIAAAALIAAESGCAFVKTSTGFCGGGANVRDVGVMKACVEGYEWSGARDRVQVKASGGVRSFDTWKEMVEAGATRIGTSNGVAIMNGFSAKTPDKDKGNQY